MDGRLEQLSLAIDGKAVATVPASEDGAAKLVSFYASSAGTTAKGDHVLLDEFLWR